MPVRLCVLWCWLSLLGLAGSSACAGLLGDLDLDPDSARVDLVLVITVEAISHQPPWITATVGCRETLKGAAKQGDNLRIRYPDHGPNEDDVVFGLAKEGGPWLVFLMGPDANQVCKPVKGVFASWPLPRDMPALSGKGMLEKCAEVAVRCANTDDPQSHRLAVALVNGLYRLPDARQQDRAKFTGVVEQAMRTRFEELYPPPLIADYLIFTYLRDGKPLEFRKALLHLRRASWDNAYKAVDIRDRFGLVRNPALKESMLCVMALGDTKLASFAASSIGEWGDRDCVPFAIEVLRSPWNWPEAVSCDRFLFDMAVKEPNVPEGARLTGEDRRKLQETIWTEGGLGSAEQRKARAEYWENWWKPVWVRNKPKADQAPRKDPPDLP